MRLLALLFYYFHHFCNSEARNGRAWSYRIKVGFGSRDPSTKEGINAYPVYLEGHLAFLDVFWVEIYVLLELEARQVLREILAWVIFKNKLSDFHLINIIQIKPNMLHKYSHSQLYIGTFYMFFYLYQNVTVLCIRMSLFYVSIDLSILILMEGQQKYQKSSAKHIEWKPDSLTIQVTTDQQQKQYILLSNSQLLHQLQMTLLETNEKAKPKHRIIFTIRHRHLKSEQIQAQLQFYKFCLVVVDKKTRQFQDLLYPSDFRIMLPIINKSSSATNSSKKSQGRENPLRRYASLNDLNKAIVQRMTSPQTRTITSVSSLIKQDTIEYVIFVTKKQNRIKQNNINQEIAWQQKQLSFINQQLKLIYGQYTTMIQKRQYAKYIFTRPSSDHQFPQLYQSINHQILYKPYTKSQSLINYYIITKTVILSQPERTNKLFILSNDETIVDFVMQHPWIVIAMEKCVLFIHTLKPMEYFKHQKSLVPTNVVINPIKNKSVIVVDRRRTIFLYHLGSKSPTLQAVFHVPFLIPYTILVFKTQMVIGGIDLQQIKGGFSQKHKSSCRSLYTIKQSFSTLKKQMINFEKRLQIVKISSSQAKQTPLAITNLIKTKEDSIVGCTYSNRFFLVSLKGYKLLQVQLKQPVKTALEILYMFNLLNFMLLLTNGQLIRVGIQACGQNLGAQLNLSKINKISCLNTANDVQNQYGLYLGRGGSLLRLNYLKDQAQMISAQQDGKWQRVSIDQQGIGYILNYGHYIEIKYIQK